MKALFLFCLMPLLLCLADPQITIGASEPPPISIVKAAEIAQAKLDSLNWSKEHFIREISFNPQIEKDKPAYYTVIFDPNNGVTEIDKTTTPPTVKIRFIKVSMDGTASLDSMSRKLISPSGENSQ